MIGQGTAPERRLSVAATSVPKIGTTLYGLPNGLGSPRTGLGGGVADKPGTGWLFWAGIAAGLALAAWQYAGMALGWPA